MKRSAKRPSLKTRCPAAYYSGPGERVAEFSGPSGLGGLLSIREHDGKLYVEVYRADPGVIVRAGGKDVPAHCENG